MPRGGPGSETGRKLPAGWPRTEDYLVWSWHACPRGHSGRWWRVDGGPSLAAMLASAASRTKLTRNGTRGNARLGVAPLESTPESRFVVTDRYGDPETEGQAGQ